MTLLLAGGSFLSFNTGFALWILISMIVFLWAMTKYAVPPIMVALKEREANIKESLESAEKAIAKAEKISKDNEKALREAEAKAQQIRKEAVEEAELIRTERLQKAKDEAEQLVAQARTNIEQEKKQALQELRTEVARLAVKSASMIIDQELDEKKNSKLVDSYLSDLSKN